MMHKSVSIITGKFPPVRSSINLDCLKWAEWDKVKTWKHDRKVILRILEDPKNHDFESVLHCAPQMTKILDHWSNVRCFTYFVTKTGFVFFTHNSSGLTHHGNIFNLRNDDKDGQSTASRFHIQYPMEKVTFYYPSQVFISYSKDGLMRVSYLCDDKAYETSICRSARSVLCFAYIPETKEIVTGCIGSVNTFTITGAEHKAVIHKGRSFNVSLNKHDWTFDLKVDVHTHTLLILVEKAVFGLDYKKNKVVFEIKNLYLKTTSFRSCCFYNHGEYVLTGAGNGDIKVWNPELLTLVYEFRGHSNGITALHCHYKEPLAFSSSLDGSIQIWRLDNFQRFMKLKIGNSVLSMSLSRDEIVCQTNYEIKFYHLDYFYKIFADIEAMVVRLDFYQGKDGKPNRIFCALEDGSFRLLSVITGESLVSFYPMTFIQRFTEFCYNIKDELIYAVLPDGSVLIMQTIVNPSTAFHVLKPRSVGDQVKKLCIFDVSCDTIEDTVVFAGLSRGQIILMDAMRSQFAGIKEHEGEITYLKTADDFDSGALGFPADKTYLVSGSDDLLLKLWQVEVHVVEKLIEGATKEEYEMMEEMTDVVKTEKKLVLSLVLLMTFECSGVPNCVCISHDMMALSYMMSEYLNMYKMTRDESSEEIRIKLEHVNHSTDYDHKNSITVIRACPAVEIFATCCDTGVVKIWNYDSEMIRELNFNRYVSGMCFCNSHGDLLVGFYCYVLIVHIVHYLSLEKLTKVVETDFKDDIRESPMCDDYTLDPRQVSPFTVTFTPSLPLPHP
ncbi:WD repeat-containing protein 87-like [Gigantopelta aegis]|uniref:WD repeat-containing protein 87-like n=1 Tax=Gigantopelta aegis TaxID=1735272 RepID=UPI001B88BABD|nr:WD repeat-containing protein 87-like [Gigantopelta aegis]